MTMRMEALTEAEVRKIIDDNIGILEKVFHDKVYNPRTSIFARRLSLEFWE